MSNFDLIKDFHAKFDPVGREEGLESLLSRRVMYLVEECRETMEAAEETLVAEGSPDMKKAKAHLVKELVDVLHVTYGFLNLLGVDANAAFQEVHDSNMTKTPNVTDEKVGKAIKGDGYVKAKMEKFV